MHVIRIQTAARWGALALSASLALAMWPAAWGWSNHALGSWQSLRPMQELASLPPVRAETLAEFLRSQGPALETVLSQHEAWARQNQPQYPLRPDALAYRFDASLDDKALIVRFTQAMRINPGLPMPLFLQLPPDVARQPPAGRVAITPAELTVDNDPELFASISFSRLQSGDWVNALDVVATASDEPDYGMDLGLFEDNGTPQGALYGFGKQPFGNPKIVYSSQAPFHMGFFHEGAVIETLVPFVKRTHPEHRVHQALALARQAMRSGHAYWGWRFAGWAMHYVQDLTQPYHARVVPGVSTVTMVSKQALSIVGMPGPKNDAITLVSNRHLALENFQRNAMLAPWLAGRMDDPALRAYAEAPMTVSTAPWGDNSLRDIVTVESFAEADAVDALLAQQLPAKYVNDPRFDFGASKEKPDLYALLGTQDPAARDELSRRLGRLFANFGVHSRAIVRSIGP